MVNKCAAFGCKSGYKNNPTPGEGDQKVTFHAYPLQNKELCDKWIRANPRKDFIPSKHSKLCSLHFKPNDFVEIHNDSNKRRQKGRVDDKLIRRYLKADAVPSVFSNAPEYLSSTGSTPRTTLKATSASRREQEAKVLGELEDTFVAEDDISDLTVDELAHRLQHESPLPDGFTISVVGQSLLIFITEAADDVPSIKACISVRSDHSVVVSMDRKVVPVCHYKDLLSFPLKLMSQLVNLMARVKSWCDEPQTYSSELLVEQAIQCLAIYIDSHDDDQLEYCRKLRFIVEQLKLITKTKFGRQYSPQLTILAYMTHAASSSAYTVLRDENVLCLPSVSTLRKITRRLDADDGLDSSAYLTLRVSKLTEYERNVILMIDEIYVAKRAEYAGGEVTGLTADGSVASTLLCFMVKSVAGKFRDLVAMYPMSKLTALKQFECYKEVMTLLRKVLLNVVAISVDNASTNRKFLVDCLCDGNLKTAIMDSETGQPIHLIFDPVHDLKNVYNNFQCTVL